MQIPPDEGKLFYKLHAALCSHANRALRIIAPEFSTLEQFLALSEEERWKVKQAVYAQPELIDRFVSENPADLSTDELAIVAGWKHAVAGRFYVFRYLQPHAVFLRHGTPPKAYGVLALATPFEEIVGSRLPVLIETVLLSINRRIIYDGQMRSYPVSFGPGIRSSLNESYRQAKQTAGIITALPEEPSPPRAVKRQASAGERVAAGGKTGEVKDRLEAIVRMTDAFCSEHLNDEYAAKCRDLAAVLARKRPSPLARGELATWACGIVRTIGWVNFLDDRSGSPHLKLPFIDRAFGVAESTGQGKSKLIRGLLKIRAFDRTWTLTSRMASNPTIWLLSVDGMVMDIRYASRELQAAAYEKGLIPYIPADREGTHDDR